MKLANKIKFSSSSPTERRRKMDLIEMTNALLTKSQTIETRLEKDHQAWQREWVRHEARCLQLQAQELRAEAKILYFWAERERAYKQFIMQEHRSFTR